MRFDAPHLLTLLPVAIGMLAVIYWMTYRRKARLLAQFGDRDLVQQLIRDASIARRRVKALLVFAGVSLAIVALTRPQYGILERPLRRKGVEIVVAVDCSLSMLGQDISPNRLERAKAQLRGLIQRLQGDNVAIIAYAGIPVVLCPMTSDYDMALNMLDTIGVDTVPVKGTSISKAIEKATDTFQYGGDKVLVLLTDGEDLDADPVAAARKAADKGVRIFAIGIGSPEGAPIPLPEGGYKEGADGKINTRLDFEKLRQIAFATKGKAILANASGDLEVETIAKDIRALRQSEFQNTTATVYAERFQYFLLPAILFLMAEMLIGDRKKLPIATAPHIAKNEEKA
jgi:Ca-activated chloride channel family protein